MRSSTSCTTSPVPTFALINGMALGGGLEVTLHCHYRTVSAAAAGIALPECFLGLVPGWGGAFLVPNLIGIERAVTVIIENPLSQNRMLDGTRRVRARAGRRDVRRRRLPGALAGLGRPGGRGTAHRRARPGSTADAGLGRALAEARAFVDARSAGPRRPRTGRWS